MSKRLTKSPEPVGDESGHDDADTICRVTSDGRVLIDYPGNPGAPLFAKYVYAFADDDAAADTGPSEVVLLQNVTAAGSAARGASQGQSPTDWRQELVSSEVGMRKRVVIDAQDELTIKCGRSSITLTRGGKVVVKGTKIVSRATGEHKIRGGEIKLN